MTPLRLMTEDEEKDGAVLDVPLDKAETIAVINRARELGYVVSVYSDGKVIFSRVGETRQ